MSKNKRIAFIQRKAAVFAAAVMTVVTAVSGKGLATVMAADEEEFTRTAIEITEDMGNG